LAVDFCDLLFQNDFVKPAGLGARDTLRLEAGLCLHGNQRKLIKVQVIGNDVDDTINPAEAVLMWTVRKDVVIELYVKHYNIY